MLELALTLYTGAVSALEAPAAGVEEGVATKLPPIVDLLELLGPAVLVEVRVMVVRDSEADPAGADTAAAEVCRDALLTEARDDEAEREAEVVTTGAADVSSAAPPPPALLVAPTWATDVTPVKAGSFRTVITLERSASYWTSNRSIHHSLQVASSNLSVRLSRATGLEAAAVVVGMGKLGGLDVVGSGDFKAGSTPDRVVSWQFGNAIVANVL